MLNFICGEIVAIENDYIVVKNNGIGYQLVVSAVTASKLTVGEQVQLFCYLQVREDCLVLFGFGSLEERNMFFHLISVSGIGPKMAITILSGITTGELAVAIVNGSTSTLSSIKGLGKRTAERVVLELREKMSIAEYAQTNVAPQQQLCEEAIAVLVSLGIKRNEAKERVKQATESGLSSTEEILNFCLKNF